MDQFTGSITFAGDDGYEQARVGRVFNARRPDRLPAAVLEAQTDSDVVEGVRLARERGWRVSVRSGGHSWPALSVRDEVLLIDLGQMRAIEVDAERGVARVQPAATGRELLPVLAEHGLMFQTGHAPDVGLGGFLLQGGAGWNTRGWGWACEQVLAVEVVTADGEKVRASADENEDLFWAARGAGHGFFGVVTSFELATRPWPGAITSSLFVYPLDRFDDVMRWALENQADISPDVEFGVIGGHSPEGGAAVVMVYALALTDTPEEGAAALLPFEENNISEHAVMAIKAQPSSFDQQFAIVEGRNPSRLRYEVDSAWINAGPDETVDALREVFTTLPSEDSEVLWMSMGPRREMPDMAFSLPTESYFSVFAKWEDEADDATYVNWVQDQMTKLDPISEGVFLGDCDLVRRPARFLADANMRRLEEIRAERDPDGLFCSFLTAESPR